MITMHELVDLRMQQHIAHEIYRQQIMQRIPDPFPPTLPITLPIMMSRNMIMPMSGTLPEVELTLQNNDLWKKFHQIGTEMVITKVGRRMFPSMRLSISGLDANTNYCIMLEMVPIGDCRYKFSGSQWVPAGGAEPQSPHRMYLHPDSLATGAHWQAHPILFNKVKLTNNTLDTNGHIVLTSMHKYQPRLHIICTSDLAQISMARQQSFIFPETQFVAVTAYQNHRVTKLKIDNNPFAKGFREARPSRDKRKRSTSPTDVDQDLLQTHSQSSRSLDMSPSESTTTAAAAAAATAAAGAETATAAAEAASTSSNSEQDEPQIKCLRSNDSACSLSSSLDGAEPVAGPGANSMGSPPGGATSIFMQHFKQSMQTILRPSLINLACTYFTRPAYEHNEVTPTSILQAESPPLPALALPHSISAQQSDDEAELDVGSESTTATPPETIHPSQSPLTEPPAKRRRFSISAILGGNF